MREDGRIDRLLLWNVRIVDGPVRGHAVVELADGRISAVGEAAGAPPEGARDCAGLTLLPGLIDAHQHVSSDVSRSPGFGPPPALKGEDARPRELGYFILANAARDYLRAGFTTIRDVGSYDEEAIVLRRAIELGLLDGPRILSCARILSATSPGGRMFGTMYHEADGPWELRHAVREQIRRGADFIKLMATGARSVELEDVEPAQLTREEVDAIVDEAHRLGLRVAAHAEGLEGTRVAIESGVDTIEHGLALHREPRLLDQMAERGTVLVPTLSTFHDIAERFADRFTPSLVDLAKRQLEEAYTTLVAARDAGVVIASGFDSGPPAESATEIVRLAEGGLGAAGALEAATRGGALALGLDDIGAVEPGKAADLVLVDGDPLADIHVLTDLTKIRLVVRGGRVVAGVVGVVGG